MADDAAEPGVARMPAETTSFVGREAERSELTRLLAAARLVTLTGVGGVGKTRLALRVARDVQAGYSDGVSVVELSALSDPRVLGHTIARALGLRDQSNRSQLDVLTGFFAERRLLLVLDTCEQLVAECGTLALALLRAAPGLRIMATSRRVLGVSGEHALAVRPLPVGAASAASGAPGKPGADCADDAVRLFLDRAAEVDPDFERTAQQRGAVAALCRRLDGIPLAIELAAVLLGTMRLEDIAQRLDDRFQLLEGGPADGPARHQALRTAIGWSHELCEPAERLLWARLSVFAGRFDLSAAEFVCSDGRLPAAGIHELLSGLVAKSIVLRDGGTGYRLLDTLREYGLEWLRRLDAERELRRRHRAYVLELAREFDEAWCGPDQVRWAARMGALHADVHAALGFCLGEPAEHRVALDLAGTLWFFWYGCGFLREGRHYLERALALDGSPGPVRTRALWVCAVLAVVQGDLAAVDRLVDECRRAMAEDPGSDPDGSAAAWVAYCRAAAAAFRGDFTRSVSLSAQAVRRHESSDDPGCGRLMGLVVMAYGLLCLGELEAARVALEEQSLLAEMRGEVWAHSHGGFARSMVELALGDTAAAQDHARAALVVKRRLGDSLGIALALDLLAEAAAASGDGGRAAVLLGIGRQVWHSFGRPQFGAQELSTAVREAESRARALIGDEAYRDEERRGGDLELDAALAYALGEDPGGTAYA